MKKFKKIAIALAMTALCVTPILSVHSMTLLELTVVEANMTTNSTKISINNPDNSISFKITDERGISYTGNFDFSEGRISQDASGSYYYTFQPISISQEISGR